MKKLTVLLSSLLLLALFAGCNVPAKGLAAVPEGAQLVYTNTLDGTSGTSVTYGSWLSEQNAEGTVIVEILCTGGSMKDVKLECSALRGGGTAHIGSVSRTGIYELEGFHMPGGNYFFNISKMKNFTGTLNIYFLPA